MGTIDGYTAELDRALSGPRRAKRDLVAEVRDHLTDAADAYTTRGLDDAEAAQRAVADFGAVGDIVPEYRTELALAQGRRTALLTFAVLLVQPLIWQNWWPWFEGYTDASDRGFVVLLDAAMETAGAVAITLSALAVVVCGIGTRYLPARQVASRLTALLALTCCVTFTILGLLLAVQGPASATMMAISVASVVGFLVLPLCVVATSARRCLRLA